MFLPNLAFTVHQQAAAAPPAAEVEEDDDEGHKSALQRYKMVDARLRRLCERKGSGKLKVPLVDGWGEAEGRIEDAP